MTTGLETLLRRKVVTVLGVNSGTSIDGLDLSVVRILQRGKHNDRRLRITPLMRRAVSFPPDLRAELMRIATERAIRLERLALLDEAFGEFIGRACRTFIRHCCKKGITVNCIASHGQTARHYPDLASVAGVSVRSSLQIGSPERIAAVTNRIVVSHFRQADTALGGEGAPITTEAVYHCLRDRRESRLVVNIGGIANFFYLPSGADGKSSLNTLAEDIGPGNLLLDQMAKTLFAKPFDKAGALAKSGAINKQLLRELSLETFFTARTMNNSGANRGREVKRRSTGREQYGCDAVKKILRRSQALGVEKRSIMSTLTELTARKIYHRLCPLLRADKRLQGIYLTGGGVKNTFLVQRLGVIFKEGDVSWRVRSVSDIGMNPDSFEATCYAVLGWMCLQGVPAISLTAKSLATSCANTGQSRVNKQYMKKHCQLTPILGRIIQAPQVSKV